MTTWHSSEPYPVRKKRGIAGLLRAASRATALVLLIYSALAAFLAVRVLERPWGRPVTPKITKTVCGWCLRVLGIRLSVSGRRMDRPGVVVSNHVSWIDIFTLNATQAGSFVARRDVGSWFGIGILAKATGSLFIERDARQAAEQIKEVAKRLSEGDTLMFFPEGTSTDGLRVLTFKPALFAAMFDGNIRDSVPVQPVTLRYRPADGDEDPRLLAWWGDMEFTPHLLDMLSAPGGWTAELELHPPVTASAFRNRKELAQHCESEIRGGFGAEAPSAPSPARAGRG